MITETSARIRKQQSLEQGIRAEYLLSSEFQVVAQTLTGLSDPTFYEMKAPFFFGPKSMCAGTICPRDLKKGSSFVDSLPKCHRGRATHFLSWTWAYKYSLVRSALSRWIITDDLTDTPIDLFMCFFVNNQYRILSSTADSYGSDDLDTVFEGNLRRIGNVVALLDSFDEPYYLTRIWTIFEQFTAVRLGITVRVIMPEDSREQLIEQFERGRDGILRVKASLSKVDSKSAKAMIAQDEVKVKQAIE